MKNTVEIDALELFDDDESLSDGSFAYDEPFTMDEEPGTEKYSAATVALVSSAQATPTNKMISPATMKRYEMKYKINSKQEDALLKIVKRHMEEDKYGKTSIASLYYDTPDRRLIRASLEKPQFKEKIRLRSYGEADENSPLYLEIKRKTNKVVYKRRLMVSQAEADAFFNYEKPIDATAQIAKEITYFRDYYKSLEPACVIIYDRVAFVGDEGNLRLTFDERPRYRIDDLKLSKNLDGTLILPEGELIMEIKAQESLPLWLTGALDSLRIRKTSFSKYGEAYIKTIIEKQQGEGY